jgi:cephalosporin-C deacetylase-like acetyl esterase
VAVFAGGAAGWLLRRRLPPAPGTPWAVTYLNTVTLIAVTASLPWWPGPARTACYGVAAGVALGLLAADLRGRAGSLAG